MTQVASKLVDGKFALVATDSRLARRDGTGYDAGGKLTYVPEVGFLTATAGNGGSALSVPAQARAAYYARSVEELSEVVTEVHDRLRPECRARGREADVCTYLLATVGPHGPDTYVTSVPDPAFNEESRQGGPLHVASANTPMPPSMEDGGGGAWGEAADAVVGARELCNSLRALGGLFAIGAEFSPRVSDRMHVGVVMEGPRFLHLAAPAADVSRMSDSELREALEDVRLGEPLPVSTGAERNPPDFSIGSATAFDDGSDIDYSVGWTPDSKMTDSMTMEATFIAPSGAVAATGTESSPASNTSITATDTGGGDDTSDPDDIHRAVLDLKDSSGDVIASASRRVPEAS